ncbi:MAG: GNAT family N-acetyltransferase [Clostridia bacterium]|nr:GNAT family N-acetyltransferase [Clostridia bacterium]
MVEIKHIGKSADDLRFFILMDGCHAGGITVHSVNPPCFSYGIAIAKDMRRKGIAKLALSSLFEEMKRRGFSRASVLIAPENSASLALHAALGFEITAKDGAAVTMERMLDLS